VSLDPLHDRIVIRPAAAESVSKGGVIIPDMAQEKPQRGTVVAAGPGRVYEHLGLIETTVKEGDEVLYSQYGASEIILDNEPVVVIREVDVYGIINND
jgi:chaperonin GroES